MAAKFSPYTHDPSKPLFHGTTAELNPGDIVEAGKDAKGTRGLAFATRSKAMAKKFSSKTDSNAGHVYKVEPVEGGFLGQRQMAAGGSAMEVASDQGFRVLNKVQFKESVSCPACVGRGHTLTAEGSFTEPHVGKKNALWEAPHPEYGTMLQTGPVEKDGMRPKGSN